MPELLSSFKREGEEIERRRGAGGGARDKGEKKGRERVTGQRHPDFLSECNSHGSLLAATRAF